MEIAMSQLAKQTPSMPAPSRFVQRFLLSLFGFSTAIAAVGIWIISGASADPVMSMVKLGVSLFMLIAGLSCLLAARR